MIFEEPKITEQLRKEIRARKKRITSSQAYENSYTKSRNDIGETVWFTKSITLRQYNALKRYENDMVNKGMQPYRKRDLI